MAGERHEDLVEGRLLHGRRGDQQVLLAQPDAGPTDLVRLVAVVDGAVFLALLAVAGTAYPRSR